MHTSSEIVHNLAHLFIDAPENVIFDVDTFHVLIRYTFFNTFQTYMYIEIFK